jgi:selenocysteine lyase/cysteine desulfurase
VRRRARGRTAATRPPGRITASRAIGPVDDDDTVTRTDVDGHARREDVTMLDELPERFRAEFPVTADRAYLFGGGLAPASRRVSEAVASWIRAWTFDPLDAWDGLATETDAVRERLGRLLGTDPSTIAIVDGASRASNIAVGLLDARVGSNVVVDATTYPSSLYPWMVPGRDGVEIRRAANGPTGLAAGIGDLERLVDDGTIAVCITHVHPHTGFRHDLRPIADLAHAHGAVIVADISQSAGVVPIDLVADGIDLAVGTAMKWLLGPPGIGFLCESGDLLARTGAPQVGYMGAEVDPADRTRLRLRPDARRHELGLPSLLGMPGWRAGLDIVLEAGVPAIHRHAEALVERCLDGLDGLGLVATTPRERSSRAGLVSIPVTSPLELRAFLRERGVDLWGFPRGSLIRADAGLFNDAHDIDRLLEGLAAYIAERGRRAIQVA